MGLKFIYKNNKFIKYNFTYLLKNNNSRIAEKGGYSNLKICKERSNITKIFRKIGPLNGYTTLRFFLLHRYLIYTFYPFYLWSISQPNIKISLNYKHQKLSEVVDNQIYYKFFHVSLKEYFFKYRYSNQISLFNNL